MRRKRTYSLAETNAKTIFPLISRNNMGRTERECESTLMSMHAKPDQTMHCFSFQVNYATATFNIAHIHL